MAGRLQDVILRGLAAARPLSADVGPGTLYFATDTNVTTRNNDTMTAWESYSGVPAGTGDMAGPASAVDSHIPQFDGTTGKLLKDGLGLVTAVATPGVNTNVPSEKAVRDALIALPSGDVDGPASSVTDHIPQFADTTGKLLKDGLGVATVIATPGVNTQVATEKAVRDAITAIPASGGDVVGPASAISGNLAVFDGTTGKLIKDGGAVPSGGGGGGGGAFQFIEEQSPSGVSAITFSALGAFTHLEIRYTARGSQAAINTSINITFNGDTGANYDLQYLNANGTTVGGNNTMGGTSAAIANAAAASAPANSPASGIIWIEDYRGTAFYKAGNAQIALKTSNASGGLFVQNTGFAWRNAGAITSITLTLASGTFVAGSKFTLYGIGNTNAGGATVSTIAVVNQTGTFDAASLTTIASPAAVHTTGNAIAVLTRSGVAAQTVSGVVDTAGNTYTKVIEFPWYGGANTRLEFWLATNIVGHATNIVTATFSGSAGNRAINIVQLSGVETAGTIVASAGTTAVGGTVVATDIYNVRNAILLVGAQTDAIGSVWTPGTGFVSVGSDPSTVTYLEAAIVGNTSVDIIPTAGNSGGSQKAMIYMTLNAKNSASATSVSGSGGALVLLSTQTAAASASLDFTTRNVTGQSGAIFQSDYDEYRIEFINIIPASNSILSLRMSTNGGSTYDSGSNYGYAFNYSYASNSGGIGSTSATSIQQREIASTLAANGSYNGYWNIFNPLGTSHKVIIGQTATLDNSVGYLVNSGGGVYRNTSPVDAFQVFMASGNITSGTIRVYGLAKTSTGSGGSSGAVVQVKNFQTGAVATTTTIIPPDDTIPQITEGAEFMTLAVTPTSATNKLKVDVTLVASSSIITGTIIAALFQDAVTDALAAAWATQSVATGLVTITFSHYMTAGTTSSITFRLRAGPAAAATLTLNGQSSARRLGGISASSITITEIVP